MLTLSFSTPSMTLVAAPGTLLVDNLNITVTNQLGYPVGNGALHDQPGQRIASHKGDDRRRGQLSSMASPAWHK